MHEKMKNELNWIGHVSAGKFCSSLLCEHCVALRPHLSDDTDSFAHVI